MEFTYGDIKFSQEENIKLDELFKRTCKIAEVAMALNCGYAHASNVLHFIQKAGLIIKVRRGVYGYAPETRTA